MLMVKILKDSPYDFSDSFPFDKPVPAKWFVEGLSVLIHSESLIINYDDDWIDNSWYCFMLDEDCEVVEE